MNAFAVVLFFIFSIVISASAAVAKDKPDPTILMIMQESAKRYVSDGFTPSQASGLVAFAFVYSQYRLCGDSVQSEEDVGQVLKYSPMVHNIPQKLFIQKSMDTAFAFDSMISGNTKLTLNLCGQKKVPSYEK